MGEEREYTIYKIVNLIDNKMYIGRTVNLKHRKSQHLSKLRRNKHVNEFLQNDWNEFGECNFEFNVVEKLVCTVDEADSREIYWINYYNTLDNTFGYNNKEGGIKGHHTDIAKNKLREFRTGTKLTLEAKRKMSITRTGMKLSEETKIKIGNAHRGKKVSRETIEKRLANMPDRSGENHPMWGKHHSEETKAKISKSHIGLMNGEKNPRATITEKQAIYIVKMISKGVSTKDISIETGVSRSKINDIKRGKAWRHLMNQQEVS